MKSAVLCCLVVLSLGLSAAPAPVAADLSMGSMLSVFSRGLLSMDASKKVCIAVSSHAAAGGFCEPNPDCQDCKPGTVNALCSEMPFAPGAFNVSKLHHLHAHVCPASAVVLPVPVAMGLQSLCRCTGKQHWQAARLAIIHLCNKATTMLRP